MAILDALELTSIIHPRRRGTHAKPPAANGKGGNSRGTRAHQQDKPRPSPPAASGNLRLCLKLLSCWKDMEYGAPQGSIPGSLLFNIRLCDPHCLLEDLDITSYADDTKIYTLKENKESITTL